MSSKCGQKTEIYSRVSGYMRPINNWNKGKREEFKDRKMINAIRAIINTEDPKEVSHEISFAHEE